LTRTIPDIPLVYERFPDDYVNDINGWAFDEETIANNVGKLLTLDIDFASRCSLNCPYCFRRDNSVDAVSHEMQFDDCIQLIKDAKKLGLRSVKFLGKGEPFETTRIIEFLRFLKEMNIIPLIFTKGHILGDDEAIKREFLYYGIKKGEDLVNELNECNASVMLGFNAFTDEIQIDMIDKHKTSKYRNHISKRNKALKLLVEGGFNKSNPTRLALAVNPIIKGNPNSNIKVGNLHEAFEMYTWSRLRNIYAIITPPMISGRARDGWDLFTPSEDELIDLYTNIYRFNIDVNLQTLDKIKREGIAAYAGGHPCNQVSTGLYITLNGVVLSCPGSEENIEGNIWDDSLENIWFKSNNFKRSGTFNCKCIAKAGKTIPDELYDRVLNNLCSNI